MNRHAAHRTLLFASLSLAAPFVSGNAEPLSFENDSAFRLAEPSLNSADKAKFNYGRGLFHHEFETVVHSNATASGLGPLYNASSCAACHIRDGRGHPPDEDGAVSFVLQLQAGIDPASGMGMPDPIYGNQLQDRAANGVQPEASIAVVYDEKIVTLDDGETRALRAPKFSLHKFGYGPVSEKTGFGPRIAPQMIGLGKLEAVPESELLKLADPDDADGDGISGRLNMVPLPDGTLTIGRFGWKAAAPSIRAQTEKAAFNDMGLSAPSYIAHSGDCTSAQSICLESQMSAPAGKRSELDDNEARLIAFYAANLAVPPRRNADINAVQAGERHFEETGCSSCHAPTLETPNGLIHAYTDLLIHDMGTDLADAIVAGQASPAEWRTAPLWGIGLTRQVSGQEFYLHDGRARSIEEAILWHGGEASASQAAYRALSAKERDNLLAFINSL